MSSDWPARFVEQYIGNGHDIISSECISINWSLCISLQLTTSCSRETR